MISFKKFLARKKLPVGFATIHKKDDSDAHLKHSANCASCKVAVGFATIHKPLKEDAEHEIWQKLSTSEAGARHVVHAPSGEHHATYLHKVAAYDAEKEAAHARYHNRKADEPHVMSPGSQMDTWLREKDKTAFSHHHEANLAHGEGHNRTALTQYTHRSSRLNKWLIHKHSEPKLRAPHIHKRDRMAIAPHSISDLHYYLKRETHSKKNALHAPTIVHSGVGAEMTKILHSTKVGDVVHFPAYTSTSTNHMTAHSFTSSDFAAWGGDDRTEHQIKHLVHFHLPKGYRKGRHVENITTNGSEHEMILHHGQSFKKVDHGETHEHYFSPMGSKRKDTVIHHHFVPVD